MAIKLRSYPLVDTIFLLNSIVSTLPIPVMIFFLLGKTLSEENISFMFSLKFWGSALFSLSFISFSKILNVRSIIILSVFIKIPAFLYFFIFQDFYSAIVLIGVSAFSASLFSTASKIYIQSTSKAISESLSRRFTVNNIGVSISPLFFLFLDNINDVLLLILLMSFILLIFTLLLDNIECPASNENTENIKFKINNDLVLFLFLACSLFSVFYLTYEKEIPILLEKSSRKGFYSFLVLLNTMLIILFQIKIYSVVTQLIGVYKALLLSYLLCFICYLVYSVSKSDSISIIVFIIGLTYLEMFFSTSVDYIIISKTNSLSKYYFTLFNILIATGISLASYFLHLEGYSIYIVLLLLILLYFFIIKVDSQGHSDKTDYS